MMKKTAAVCFGEFHCAVLVLCVYMILYSHYLPNFSTMISPFLSRLPITGCLLWVLPTQMKQPYERQCCITWMKLRMKKRKSPTLILQPDVY